MNLSDSNLSAIRCSAKYAVDHTTSGQSNDSNGSVNDTDEVTVTYATGGGSSVSLSAANGDGWDASGTPSLQARFQSHMRLMKLTLGTLM